MLMGALALLAALSVPLSGKDLRRLGALRVRATGLLPLALGLQVLVIDIVPDVARPVAVGVHLATYLLAGAFLLGNRHLPGLPLLGVGAALNAVTIAANGGTLPASREALRFAGLASSPRDFTNSGVLPAPRLPWLGDVFALPAGLPWANVFSLGDVLILTGAVVLLHRACAPSASVPPLTVPGAPDPLLLVDRRELVDELDRTCRALREVGARNDALARALAEGRSTPSAPVTRSDDDLLRPRQVARSGA